MPLTRVTISGADDAVDPAELQALSKEFPFVEWGILFSWKRHGTPRYPSQTWMNRLGELCAGDDLGGMQLAAHFCGAIARTVLDGQCAPLEVLSGEYRRVQLNGWTGELNFLTVPQHYSEEFILQVWDEPSLALAHEHARRVVSGTVSALFDPSGGRGVWSASSWPSVQNGFRVGFAGGITPDNVLGAVGSIGPRGYDFWIDMESGVRTDDQFDLAKVRKVLVQVAPLVKEAAT